MNLPKDSGRLFCLLAQKESGCPTLAEPLGGSLTALFLQGGAFLGVSRGLSGSANFCLPFWSTFRGAGCSRGTLACLANGESVKKRDRGPLPGCCPSTVPSPVQGNLPVTLDGNRHPVQASCVVRRIDAAQQHHAAAIVIAVERGGKKGGHSFIHSLIQLNINYAHSESYSPLFIYFFWQHSQCAEVPGPGIELEPQQ